MVNRIQFVPYTIYHEVYRIQFMPYTIYHTVYLVWYMLCVNDVDCLMFYIQDVMVQGMKSVLSSDRWWLYLPKRQQQVLLIEGSIDRLYHRVIVVHSVAVPVVTLLFSWLIVLPD